MFVLPLVYVLFGPRPENRFFATSIGKNSESFFEKQSQVNQLLNKALQLFIENKDKVWQGLAD